MSQYIVLVKYTSKGIANIKESPNRHDKFVKLCESMDARLEAMYLTMGRYDIILVVNAPNPETMAKLILAQTSTGAVSTETLQAFPETEFRKIISELP